MTDRAAMLALIERGYAARRAGDVERLCADFHADATFRMAVSPATTSVALQAKGRENIQATLAGMIGAFHFLDQEFVSILIDQDRAMVHTRTTVRYNPTQVVVVTEILDLWHVTDGEIVELVEFADTALVNHLLAGGAAP
jgi:ketosteroid isomerase-like protein